VNIFADAAMLVSYHECSFTKVLVQISLTLF
jgi:hypothetical protein